MAGIYVAAPWKNKGDAKNIAQQLRDAGLTVVSRWHDNVHEGTEFTEDILKRESQMDYEDIFKADTHLHLNYQMSEGKATELGISLARGVPIYVVGGTKNNVFLNLPQVNHLASVEEFINVCKPE